MDVKKAIRETHDKAWAKAVNKLPEIDINTLISLIESVATKEQTPEEAASKLAMQTEDAFKVYVKVFSEVAAENIIDDLLEQSSRENMKKLSESEFAKKVVKCTEKIQKDVSLYMNGKIDAAEMIERIGKTDLSDLVKQFAGAAGINISKALEVKDFAKELKHIHSASLKEISMLSLTAAYVILQNTLHDAHLTHLEDEKIIAQCKESTQQIVRYRQQLEIQMNQYLSGYSTVFEKGFANMDQSLINGDSNQYIAGNAEIQNALGRYVQFWDQKSFEEMMKSDEALKL